MVSKGEDKLDRREKVKSRTARMDAVRESYNPIVPSKQANEGRQARQEHAHRPEESGQERGLAKGNAEQSPTTGTQSSGKKVSRGLVGVRQAAERTGSCSLQRCCTTSAWSGCRRASGD